MSTNTISIKSNNHRIYQCPTSKKLALLNKIVQETKSDDIIIVCSDSASKIQEELENKNIKVLEDREFIKNKELTCAFLLSYDMPINAVVYMARVAKATEKAVMLLDENEQKQLYKIEALLGRAIKQEKVDGFEYEKVQKQQTKPQRVKKLSKDEIKDVAKKRYEQSTQEKPQKDERWEKKKKAPNKLLGKDDNGKAIFSGKTGDRNHRYDGTPKDKYNAPKMTGKKINIKARKNSK